MSRRRHARRGGWLKQVVSIAAAIVMIAATILILRGTGRVSSSAVPTRTPAPTITKRLNVSFADAAPILDALGSQAPADIGNLPARERPAAWDAWVAGHDADIRARLEGGDEDSVVNFWLFGTTFTSRPRATSRDMARLGDASAAEALLIGRLDDLVAAAASPGTNERLWFVRRVLERRGIDVRTSEGQERARIFLVETRARTIAEQARFKQTLGSVTRAADEGSVLAAYSTLYRDRGLSSDTSIAAAFALDRTIAEMAASGRIARGTVTRVAIVGPGLDFTDKAEGYDFYPVQTIQPYAIADSLVQSGLARAGDMRITTFDLSPRVNQHLEAARDRAQRSTPYALQLPLVVDDPGREWHPDLVQYWHRLGTAIGGDIMPLPAPPGAGQLRMRAVRIRPEVAAAISPVDLNIVLQRLDAASPDDRFDLIIATNVLVYYGPFDQALALSNIAAMLRPGGYLLTNYAMSPSGPLETSPALVTKVFWDRLNNGDTLFWHRRQ